MHMYMPCTYLLRRTVIHLLRRTSSIKLTCSKIEFTLEVNQYYLLSKTILCRNHNCKTNSRGSLKLLLLEI